MSRILKKSTIVEDPVIINRNFTKSSISKEKKEKNGNITPENINFSAFLKNEISHCKDRLLEKIGQHDDIYKESIEKAYDEGYEKGLNDGIENERQNKIKMIEMLLDEAKEKNKNAIKNLELKVIELAITMADSIVRRSIEIKPSAMLDIVSDTISNLIGGEKVILKLSPDDFRVVNEKYEKWLTMAGSPKEFRIEIDKRLIQGDCIVETESGIIDGVVKERLNVFFEELLKSN